MSCAWREDDHDEEQRTNESADAAHCLKYLRQRCKPDRSCKTASAYFFFCHRTPQFWCMQLQMMHTFLITISVPFYRRMTMKARKLSNIKKRMILPQAISKACTGRCTPRARGMRSMIRYRELRIKNELYCLRQYNSSAECSKSTGLRWKMPLSEPRTSRPIPHLPRISKQAGRLWILQALLSKRPIRL